MDLLALALAFIGALFGGYGAARAGYQRSRLDELLHAAPEYAAVLRSMGRKELASGLHEGDSNFDRWNDRMSPHVVDLPPQLREAFTDRERLDPAAPVDDHAHRLLRTADMLDAFVKSEADHRDKWSWTRNRRTKREQVWLKELGPEQEPFAMGRLPGSDEPAPHPDQGERTEDLPS